MACCWLVLLRDCFPLPAVPRGLACCCRVLLHDCFILPVVPTPARALLRAFCCTVQWLLFSRDVAVTVKQGWRLRPRMGCMKYSSGVRPSLKISHSSLPPTRTVGCCHCPIPLKRSGILFGVRCTALRVLPTDLGKRFVHVCTTW